MFDDDEDDTIYADPRPLHPKPQLAPEPDEDEDAFAALSLDELGKAIENVPEWLIEGALPFGGKVILSAPAKAGKSTMIGNVIRSLVDGTPFLDRFPVKALGTFPEIDYDDETGEPCGIDEEYDDTLDPQSVLLIDTELSPTMLRRWLDDQGISPEGRERVKVLSLRGRGLDLADEKVYERFTNAIIDSHAKIVILDPLGPILRAAGRDENRSADLGPVLAALDQAMRDCGVALLLVHHHGHSGERARGASLLRDWPDAEWIMTTDGERRALSMRGRDVELPETVLAYDRETRHLTLGEGDRQSTAVVHRAGIVVEILTETPGLVTNALRAALHSRGITATAEQSKAIAAAKSGAVPTVHTHDGPKNAKIHYVGHMCGPECASATSRTSGTSSPTSTTVSSSTTTSIGSTAHTRLIEGKNQDRSSSTTRARSLRVVKVDLPDGAA